MTSTTLRTRGRLTRRLALLFIGLTIAGSVLTGGLALWFEMHSLSAEFDEKLMAIANVAALHVDGDTFATFKTEADTQRPEFKALATYLNVVLNEQKLTYSYTVVKGKDDLPTLVVDGSAEPEVIGEEYAPRSELLAVYETGKPQITAIYSEEPYGDLKTAYAPIRNSKGDVVGAVAVDMSDEQIYARLYRDLAVSVPGPILVAILATFVALRVARRIATPISQAAEAAQRLAAGDLTVEPLATSSKDEVGDLARAFNDMVGSLQGVIAQVGASTATVADSTRRMKQTAGELAEAAHQAGQAMDGVAHGAEAQAAAIGETTRVVHGLQTAIAQIAAGAGEQARNAELAASAVAQMVQEGDDVVAKAASVAASAQQAAAVARDGSAVVQRTVTGMGQVRRTVLESADQIRDLGRLSGQVGTITEVITAIAEQTDLLALNAAIEAARAGEHGKGFAVVADEVRRLAEKAGRSASDIADLVAAIQRGTAKAVHAMERGTAEVEQGSKEAAEAGRALTQILSVVESAAADAGAIAAAAKRLAASSRQVMEAVTAVAAITEENSAATEEMAAGSNEVTTAISAIASVAGTNAESSGTAVRDVNAIIAEMKLIAESAESMAEAAQVLKGQVARFRI